MPWPRPRQIPALHRHPPHIRAITCTDVLFGKHRPARCSPGPWTPECRWRGTANEAYVREAREAARSVELTRTSSGAAPSSWRPPSSTSRPRRHSHTWRHSVQDKGGDVGLTFVCRFLPRPLDQPLADDREALASPHQPALDDPGPRFWVNIHRVGFRCAYRSQIRTIRRSGAKGRGRGGGGAPCGTASRAWRAGPAPRRRPRGRDGSGVPVRGRARSPRAPEGVASSPSGR